MVKDKAKAPTSELPTEQEKVEQLECAAPLKKEVKRDFRDPTEYDLELVKGVFRNFESPGSCETVIFKKFRDPCPMFKRVMWDGQEYEIPRYVANFLQGYDALCVDGHKKINSCAQAIGNVQTETGVAMLATGTDANSTLINAPVRYQKRVGFEPIGFM